MVKHTWKGPGVFGHADGDILPGKPMPADMDAETLARLVDKGSVVKGDLPATTAVTDELTLAKAAHVKLVAKVESLTEQLQEAITAGTDLATQVDTVTKELADADELLKDVNAREQEIVAANTSLTEQLEAANKNVAEMTALMTAPVVPVVPADAAGPKGGKK